MARSTADAEVANNFNLLRVIAAWLVLFSHSYHLSGNSAMEPLLIVTNGKMTFGTVAVGVFFTISGYLITGSAFARPTFFSFIEARARRIFPALLFVTICSAFVLGPFVTTLSSTEYISQPSVWTYVIRNASLLRLQWELPGVFVGNYFGTAVNGSLWTLPVEFSLYLGIGLSVVAVRLGNFETRSTALLVPIAIFILICWIVTIQGSKSGAVLLIPYFLIGAAVKILGNSWRRSGWIFSALLVATWGCVAANSILFPVIACFAISYGTLWIAEHKKWVCVFPVKRIGDLSYGIYLFAFPVQQTVLAQGLAIYPWEINLIATAIVLPISWASWHLVEQRFVSKKQVESACILNTVPERSR